MMSYKTACRLCLKDLQGCGIDCLGIEEMREAIHLLFGFTIKQTDTTSTICNKCFEKTMSFKAFKKTVNECQSIITEYETIKKKILQKQLTLKQEKQEKQEVIDLSDTENEIPTTSTKKKKRPAPTDSEIDDILNIIHENNNPSKGQRQENKQFNDTASENLGTKTEKTFSHPVQSSDSGNASTNTCIQESSSRTRSIESESMIAENDQENRVTPNLCLSAWENAETSEDAVKTEFDTIVTTFQVALDANATSPSIRNSDKEPRNPESEAVPSPLRTPQTLHNNNKLSESVEENRTCNISDKDDGLNNAKSDDETVIGSKHSTPRLIIKMKTINVMNEKDSGNVENPPTPTSTPNKSNDTTKSNINSTDFTCRKCSEKFKSLKDLDCHNKVHTEDSQKTTNKRSRMKRNSESSNTTTIRRSARIAKFQALHNIEPPAKIPRNRKSSTTTTPKNTSSDLHSAIAQLALTQQLLARTQVPSPTISIPSTSSSTPYVGYIRNRSHSAKNSKRIITITLLRSRDSVNFRYSDQHKNNIDFASVTPEELFDIRSSLMSPSIWSYLTGVFKTATPDDETIMQLKTIFGQGFRWS